MEEPAQKNRRAERPSERPSKNTPSIEVGPYSYQCRSLSPRVFKGIIRTTRTISGDTTKRAPDRAKEYKRQTACKPGFVHHLRRSSSGCMAIPLGRQLPAASRNLPGRLSGNGLRAIPIWSCSRWGLPCRSRCRDRGALLPHHFTLAWRERRRRFDFCGAIPGVAPGGCYPSPCFRGARTFLSHLALCVHTQLRGQAAIRPSDARRSISRTAAEANVQRCAILAKHGIHKANFLATATRL
jgi:hypothetical protein